MDVQITSEVAMKRFGEQLGALLKGGEVLELIGDVGSGKTTLTKGIAKGLWVDDDVQSPTFTISRVYDAAHGQRLVHYDFYRLPDPGIMAMELDETAHDPKTSVVVEWAETVQSVLPDDRLMVYIQAISEEERAVKLVASGKNSQRLIEGLA